jgi:hypothetical protein
MQKHVHTTLQKLGYAVHSETKVAGLPIAWDLVLEGMDRNGVQRTVVMEVDGPHHFRHSVSTRPTLGPAESLRAILLHLKGVQVRMLEWLAVRAVWRCSATVASCSLPQRTAGHNAR